MTAAVTNAAMATLDLVRAAVNVVIPPGTASAGAGSHSGIQTSSIPMRAGPVPPAVRRVPDGVREKSRASTRTEREDREGVVRRATRGPYAHRRGTRQPGVGCR